jgi:hypothetical protein
MKSTFTLLALLVNAVFGAPSLTPRFNDPAIVKLTFHQADGTPWIQNVPTDGRKEYPASTSF